MLSSFGSLAHSLANKSHAVLPSPGNLGQLLHVSCNLPVNGMQCAHPPAGYAAAASSVEQVSQRGSCVCGGIQMTDVQQQVPQIWVGIPGWCLQDTCHLIGSVQASHVQQQEAVWPTTKASG